MGCKSGKVATANSWDTSILPRGQIREYPYTDGSASGPPVLGEGTVLVDISSESTRTVPDGMTLSADGESIYVAMFKYGATETADGEVRKYNRITGKHLETYTLEGAPRATCPLVVEDKGLYFTTAHEMDDSEIEAFLEKNPNSGGFGYVAKPGIQANKTAVLGLNQIG